MECGSSNEMSHILRLNTWYLVGGAVKGCLGDVALLENGFEVLKATYHFRCALSACCSKCELSALRFLLQPPPCLCSAVMDPK